MYLESLVGITLATLLVMCLLIIVSMCEPFASFNRRSAVVWCPRFHQRATLHLVHGSTQEPSPTVRHCSLWHSAGDRCQQECLPAHELLPASGGRA